MGCHRHELEEKVGSKMKRKMARERVETGEVVIAG